MRVLCHFKTSAELQNLARGEQTHISRRRISIAIAKIQRPSGENRNMTATICTLINGETNLAFLRSGPRPSRVGLQPRSHQNSIELGEFLQKEGPVAVLIKVKVANDFLQRVAVFTTTLLQVQYHRAGMAFR